jgi:four helix bundle protein
MTKNRNSKPYDLEDRTLAYAKRVRAFVKKLPRTIANIEDIKQLVRASGSVGANYIEANESLSKKDFIMRIKICRKEAKEGRYWLRLIDTNDEPEHETDEHFWCHIAKEQITFRTFGFWICFEFRYSDFGFIR